jgi:hypothetical protein
VPHREPLSPRTDPEARSRSRLLLRISSFASTHSDEELTTLAEYVERMKDGQEQIFYATGQSREQLLKSPHLEAFKAKGYEVLLLTDPVDEIWVGSVTEFDGKPLQSVAKGEVDLDSEDEKAAHEAERQEQERDFAELLTWLKETLSDHVKEVRLSARLTASPAGSRRTRIAATIPRWSKPPNCFTAQPFSPKAAYPKTRRSSPDYSPTVWPAPCRTPHHHMPKRADELAATIATMKRMHGSMQQLTDTTHHKTA